MTRSAEILESIDLYVGRVPIYRPSLEPRTFLILRFRSGNSMWLGAGGEEHKRVVSLFKGQQDADLIGKTFRVVDGKIAGVEGAS